MNSNELESKLRAKGIGESCIRRTLNRNPADQGLGPHTGAKKLNVQHREKGKPRMEKALRPKFRISIILKFSDDRARDPDAAYSTILDCLIAARRQVAECKTDIDHMRTMLTGT